MREPALSILGRPLLRRELHFLVCAVLLCGAILFLGREIAHHIAALEAWVASLGAWGVIVFVGLFVLATSLLIPETVLGIAAGALFGLFWGFVAALAGSLLAATLQFGLARHLLRRWIQRTFEKRPSLAAIQRAVLHDELRLQALLRLTPLNPATFSYLLGAAGIRFPGFIVACLALTPHLFLEVYFGNAGKHAARMAGGAARAAELHELVMFGGLAVGIVVLALVSRAARKALLRAVPEAANPELPGAKA